MKKLYLSICALFITATSFAQLKAVDMSLENVKSITNLPVGVINNNLSAPPPPFWSNSFSDPNEWTMVDLLNGGLQNWVISTTGPTGSFSAGMGPITSTTAADGFAMYDSDALNTQYTPQEAYIQYNGTVDCSQYQFVNIQFESYHRQFSDSIYVEVSNDGSSWDRYQVHIGQASNTTSANPEIISVNVSATAGNQTNVYFRFYYVGEWDYAWMVDDVEFTETPNNFATIDDGVFGGWWIGYQSTAGLGCDYTFNPLSQLAANPYSIEAVLKNGGVAAQNMTLHAAAIDAIASPVYSSTSNTMTLYNSQQDTFVANQTFAPSAQGLYEIWMWGVGDSAFTDTIIKQTVVTEDIYGKDLGTYMGYYTVAHPTRQNHITSYYDIYADVDLTGIDVYIAPNTMPGANIYGVLYEADPAGNPLYLVQTADYTVTAADLDSWVTLPLTSSFTLIAGMGYEVAAAGYQGFDTLTIGWSGDALGTENSSFDELGLNPGGSATPGTPTWYYITKNPMIRMNFSPMTSTSTNDKQVMQGVDIYPNPAKASFSIDLDELFSSTTITIKNLLGQSVYQNDVSGMSKINIDISKFNAGVYMINIEDDKSIYSEKIIIE